MAKVLIIEDDRASARLLSLLLKKGGHEITAAYTLDDGRKVLQERPIFDLMILDNRVGENFGWELLGELREHFFFRELPVIVYTAAGDRDSIAKYVSLKVQNVRAKPYSWEVLSEEIDKALKTNWLASDFESYETVCRRLQFSRDDYHAGLRELSKKLTETAKGLLELLAPNKERAFLNALNELRSQSVNYGVNVVSKVIRECVESFREADWSRAVKSVRAFNLVAKSIEVRVKAYEEQAGELLEAADEELALTLEEPPAEVVAPVSGDAVSRLMAAEVHPIFRRMASAFAQGETVDMLVRKCVRGSIPASKFGTALEDLAKEISALAFLEPNDLEAVAKTVREVDGIEARLRAFSGKNAPDGDNLRDLVSQIGVFQAGLVTSCLKLRAGLVKANFPVRLEYLLNRLFTASQLVRAIASRIQRPVNLEAVVWLQFLGEWAFAVRFPGVYGLILLEPSDNPVAKYRTSFDLLRRPLLAKMNLPAYCKESLADGDLSVFAGVGASRLSAGLWALAEFIGDAYHLDLRGNSVDAIRKSFVESPSWELLASEQLKLPTDREKFFDTLLSVVPSLHRKAERLLASSQPETASSGNA